MIKNLPKKFPGIFETNHIALYLEAANFISHQSVQMKWQTTQSWMGLLS